MSNSIMQAESSNLVHVENGELFTTSLVIAETFGKRHCDIVRKIDEQTAELQSTQNCVDFAPSHYFERVDRLDSRNRPQPYYLLSRDGFALIAMSFTGSRALEWKLRYIAAFNAMEEKLKSPTPDNRLEIARLIAQTTPRKTAAIMNLYPEYFPANALPGSLEHTSDLNTAYTKWIEEYGITVEWIGDFPTTDVYLNYVRYCTENRLPSMGKKVFYRTLENDFNMSPRQRSDGHRYFRTA